MVLIKFLAAIGLSVGFVALLDTARVVGDSEQLLEQEDGTFIKKVSTEKFYPPIGKLLSPSHGFWQNAEAPKPSFASNIQHDFLKEAVEVVYDDRMVPHIFGQHLSDVIFVQGYVTASLRLWQMELQTHAAAGRLTEILGTTDRLRNILLERDKETRRIGILYGAENALEQWKKSPKDFEILEAYTGGINAYIEQLNYAELPLMYKLQDYRPEPWTTLKTALLMKSMARTLTARDHDFDLTAILKKLGPEVFNTLYQDYFDEQSPIILEMTDTVIAEKIVNTKPISLYLGQLGMDSLTRALSPKGVGSNNWAVSGAKTSSGHPILCNDPHLKLNLPSLWFEIQLTTPEINTYGASLPGAPGVISGFNEHIAWGVTNVSHDVRDWYAIQWKDASKSHYWFDSTWMPTTKLPQAYYQRNAEAIWDTLYMTHIGPIAHRADDQDFALRWTLHDPSEEAITFLKLMKGKNYEDYKDAIKHFSCPAQNIVFAAKNGDIALWTQGKLPLRKEQQGKFVQQGTSSDELWAGFIPQAHIPHEYNPSKNFVASANQHSINPDKYPYGYYGYFEEYRGRYLNRRLAEMEQITVQDMMDLQYDAYSVKAEDFMGILKDKLHKAQLSKEELEWWHRLKDWDCRYTAQQKAPVIFEAWFDSLRYLVYDEFVQFSKADQLNYRLPEQHNLLDLLKRDTTNPILDRISSPQKVETAADIVTISFQKMCQGFDKADSLSTWWESRATRVEHLSKVPAFSINNIVTDGHHSALNALGRRPGPSWKMVVELGDKIEAFGIYPGGQSENPGSYFYASMMEKWAKGEHYPLLFLQNKDDAADKILLSQVFKK
jgi:penicillin amidase